MMDLPFTVEEFLRVFELYNRSIWPAQLLLSALAITALIFAVRGAKSSGMIVSFILSFFWLWMGAIYHLLFFTAINDIAWVFGLMFMIQAGILYCAGLWMANLSFRPRLTIFGAIGAVLILYGLIIYPLIGYKLGHRYPATPTFGLPCPTTIFTFGILCWADRPLHYSIFVVPLIWTVIGALAALKLGMLEDFGLIGSGAAGIAMIFRRYREQSKSF